MNLLQDFGIKNREIDPSKSRYIRVALRETYQMLCLKTCFANYNEPLTGQEKVKPVS